MWIRAVVVRRVVPLSWACPDLLGPHFLPGTLVAWARPDVERGGCLVPGGCCLAPFPLFRPLSFEDELNSGCSKVVAHVGCKWWRRGPGWCYHLSVGGAGVPFRVFKGGRSSLLLGSPLFFGLD